MMTPDTGQEGSEDTRMVKNIIINLVDSVVYSQRASDVKSDIEKIKREISDRLGKVNEVAAGISSVLKNYEEEDAIKAFADTRKQITEFTSMALDQYRKKLEKELTTSISEKEEEVISDETKALRSLESFLAKDPLPLEDLGITVKATEGGYEGRARYRCGQGIKYEFTLNTRNVEVFRNLLEFTSFAKGIKIPVRTGGSWIAREPAVDFERMGKYYLSSSELSKEHLISVFTNQEKGSEFRFVYSKSEETSFVHIEYKDKAETVDITSQPALNKNLDTDALRSAFDSLMESLSILEDNKLKLSRLTLNDDDLISEMRCFDFLIQVIRLLSPPVKEAFAFLIEKAGNYITEKKNGETDREYIESRLKLLGERAPEIMKLLDLDFMQKNEAEES